MSDQPILPGPPGPEFLRPTRYIDFDRPEVRAFAEEAAAGADTDGARAIRLFAAVRNGIRYDAYRCRMEERTFRASTVVAERAGFCMPKAILLCAAARAVGIPSALGLAEVVNHLMTEKLVRLLEGETRAFHGYALLYLDGRWVALSPAFDSGLCAKFGVATLDFDGRSDALLHAYDGKGRQFMEYDSYLGVHADVPFDDIVDRMHRYYPKFFELVHAGKIGSSFAEDAPHVA